MRSDLGKAYRTIACLCTYALVAGLLGWSAARAEQPRSSADDQLQKLLKDASLCQDLAREFTIGRRPSCHTSPSSTELRTSQHQTCC